MSILESIAPIETFAFYAPAASYFGAITFISVFDTLVISANLVPK